MKKKPLKPTVAKVRCKRTQRLICTLNEEEEKVLNHYLHQYKITNKSRWMRETLLSFVLHNMELDYPTLFNEHDMRR